MRNHAWIFTLALAVLAMPALAAFQPAPPVDQDARHGTPQYDGATDLGVDAAGNVYMMIGTDGAFPGETSAGGRDVAVAKFAPDGTHLWTTQFGTTGTDNDGGEIAVTSSGLVAVAGSTTGAFPGFTFLGGFYDAFFVILDTDGNITFTDQFGTSSWDEATGVYTDGTSFYVTGFTEGTLAGQTSAGGRDGFVRRYDLSGNVTGETQFGTAGGDTTNAVAAAQDGTVFVTGFTTDAFSPSVGGNDGFVVKLDANLAFVAGANHGTTANDNYRGIGVSSAGNVVVTGSTFGAIPGQTPDGWDIVIQGIDGGDLSSRWIRQFGLTSNFDNGADVTVASDGTSYTACSTYGLEDLGAVGNEHGCVIVLDDLGSDLWNDQFIGVGATLAVAGSALDPDGGVWLAGRTAGTFGGPTVGDQDAIRRKYAPFAGDVTDITACGFVADAPGDYRLAGPVTGGGVCIDVTSAGVVIDLNGQSITSIDDGTDAPGTAIRVGAGLDASFLNQGASSAEIVVDGAGGMGFDLTGTSGASVDGGAEGLEVILTDIGNGKIGLTFDTSFGGTTRNVTVTDNGPAGSDNIGIRADDSTGWTIRDAVYASPILHERVAFAGANVDSPTFENVQSTGGSLRLDGANVQITDVDIDLTDRTPAGFPTEIRGGGTVTGFRQLGGSPSFSGLPASPLNLQSPDLDLMVSAVEIGDDVTAIDATVTKPFGQPALRFTGQVGSSTLDRLFVRKRQSDVAGDLFDADPGATADLTGLLTVDSRDDATGTTSVGQVRYVQDTLTVGRVTANVGLRHDHVASSPEVLAGGASSIDFALFGVPGATRAYRDGIFQPDCVPQPDGLTVVCPGHAGDSEFVFGTRAATTCGVHGDPGDVVILEADVTGPVGAPCIELQADVTFDCLGGEVRVPAGSPGAESIGFAITGAGASVRDCAVRLEGTDTIGVDVAANDTTLETMRYTYEYDRTIGVRAQAQPIQNLTVLDESHIGTGAGTGVRTAWSFDSVGNLVAARSVGEDPFYVYDFQWDVENSDGTITNASWTGGISASGAGVSARLVVEDSVHDARGNLREIRFGDDVIDRRGRIYANDDTPVRNVATVRGPRFESTTFYSYDERGVSLIEDNPTAPVEIVDRLEFRTERDGLLYGRTEFPPTVPTTPETGITQRYAYDDRDTARTGDDLPAEPTVKLTFERMVTPADPSSARVPLEATGQDGLANSGCAVTSAEGEPVELTCDRDLGTGTVQSETVHWVYCGDGVRNEQVADDACDPGGNATSGKCQSDCTIVPAPGALQATVEPDVVDPEGVVLNWNDTGEGPYEIFRSTDPANVVDPASSIGLTSGTTWSDLPPPGGPYYYTVVPAP